MTVISEDCNSEVCNSADCKVQSSMQISAKPDTEVHGDFISRRQKPVQIAHKSFGFPQTPPV